MDAALLAGILATHGLGEQSVSPDLTGRVTLKDLLTMEGYYSPADKFESPGWLASGSADLNLGPAIIGVRRTHRHTKAWDKDATWARAGINAGLVHLLAEYALGTPNREVRAEASLRGKVGKVAVEPHGFAEWYRDSQGQRRTGYGAGLRLGWTTSRDRK